MRNSIDIVQQRWNDWVIEYGARQQARLFSPFGLDNASPTMLVGLLFLALAVFGVILFPLVLRIRGPARRDPVQKAWHKFLQRLGRAGFAARPSSGPLELAEAAAGKLPGDATAIQRIAGLYTRCRYAPGPPPVPDLRQAVRDFRPSGKTA